MCCLGLGPKVETHHDFWRMICMGTKQIHNCYANTIVSAGIVRRTDIIIALDISLDQLKTEDIQTALNLLRQQQTQMVQVLVRNE